jgi:hypothetical protein
MFTRARCWPLPWARGTVYIVTHCCFKYILIVCSHPYLGLPSSLIPLDFLTEILYAFLFCPIVAVCPIMRLIFVCEEYKLWSSNSYCMPHYETNISLWRVQIMKLPTVQFSAASMFLPSFLLGPDILLKAFHTHINIVLHILIFMF